MMKHDKLLKLVLAALFAALTCVATSLISIPIPATNGYINLGDGMVFSARSCWVLFTVRQPPASVPCWPISCWVMRPTPPVLW